MKIKEYFYLLGIKPSDKRYGYQIKQFQLDAYGTVSYAQWSHPSEDKKVISDSTVSCLKTFLNNGDFCIDIGAHTGDTTVPMALAVGKNGLVLALEPNPFVFSVLNKNAFLNQEHTHILPLMIAACDQDGDIDFEYSDSGYCNGGLHEHVSRWKHGHAFTLTVAGMNLPNLLRRNYSEWLPRLRFIKVDAEGYDLSVLKSCSGLIDEFKPFIKAEIYKHTDHAYRESMHRFFSNKGYTIFKVNSDSELKGDKLDPDMMMNWKHYDIFCVPDSAT